MARDDSQVDKPQRGRPKLPDANINTGAQSRVLEYHGVIVRTPKTRAIFQSV